MLQVLQPQVEGTCFALHFNINEGGLLSIYYIAKSRFIHSTELFY